MICSSCSIDLGTKKLYFFKDECYCHRCCPWVRKSRNNNIAEVSSSAHQLNFLYTYITGFLSNHISLDFAPMRLCSIQDPKSLSSNNLSTNKAYTSVSTRISST